MDSINALSVIFVLIPKNLINRCLAPIPELAPETRHVRPLNFKSIHPPGFYLTTLCFVAIMDDLGA